MTRDELLHQLRIGESEDFEVKAAQRGVPDDAYKTVSAFANTAGGWIVFGIREHGGKLEVVGVSDPDHLQNDFLSTCRSSNKLNHPVDVAVTVIPVDEVQVLAFDVKPLPRYAKPLRVRVKKHWESYIRLGAGDHRCTEAEEARFLRDASQEPFDMAISEVGLEDLDSDAIAWFRGRLAERRQGRHSSVADLEPEAFLKRTGLLTKDGLTHAAALLFGLPQVMSHLKPGGIVDFRLFYADRSASHHDWDDRELADGHITQALTLLLERLLRLSPNPFEMESNGVQHRAFSRDFLAVREAFVNLLVHQDYSDRHRTARILWYRDRVLFENPGDSYLSAAEMRDGGRSAPRNPLLAQLMRQAGFIEQTGRGVVRILERWRESGRESPEIANDPGGKLYGLWLSWLPARPAAEPVAAAPTGDEPLRVGVRSFFDRGAEIEEWSHAFLPLTELSRRHAPLPEMSWPEVYRRLAAFLRTVVARRRAIHLDLVAHPSVAFAAGYLVDVNIGIKITVRQRSPRGTEDWRIEDPDTGSAPSWAVTEQTLGEKGSEIALAISCARPIAREVESYVQAELPAVSRIVEFQPPQGPGLLSVTDGGHAFRLAEAIRHEIYRLEKQSDGSRFHLFYSGPNGLLFFLGRLSYDLENVQLYEYDFDGQGNRAYMPSLSFPPPVGPIDG